jgi:leucyl-tRNA synthetase
VTSSLQDELVIDAFEVDLHRAELRIADLEADAVWHRLIARAAVASLSRLTAMVDRLREQRRIDRAAVQELQQELREVYQAMPMMSHEGTVDHVDVH